MIILFSHVGREILFIRMRLNEFAWATSKHDTFKNTCTSISTHIIQHDSNICDFSKMPGTYPETTGQKEYTIDRMPVKINYM